MPKKVKIKFYFQQNPDHSCIDSFQYEKDFNISNDISAIDKKMLYNLLERHHIISMDTIDHIRFFHFTFKAWILLNDDTIIELIGDSPHFKLLIKNHDQTDYNDSTEQVKSSIIQSIKKIKSLVDLKSIDENQNNYSVSSAEALKSESDIAVLHGNPLYDAEMNYFFRSIYDYNANIVCLRQIFAMSPLGLLIDFGICTIESFESCVKKYPKVINLICGSGYDNKGTFYLYFENSFGEVEKLNEEKLSLIFNDYEELKQNVIIILMTPFAENAMQMFKDQNFENVIAVHTTSSNANTANKFITLFYENIFNNKNPQEAFNNAKTIVVAQLELAESKNCCCFHSHKENCKWKQFCIDNPEEAHYKHMKFICKCKKDQFHKHLSSCAWAKVFEYKNSQLHLCCCQGILEHTISSTIIGFFALNYNEGDEGIVFPGNHKGINEGQTIISGKSFVLVNSINHTMTRLIGKSNEMLQVIKLLLEKNMRLISVYGSDQTELPIFSHTLFRYLYERIKRNVDVEMIDESNISQFERGFIKGNNDKIIIINYDSFKEKSLESFKKTINKIYSNQRIKIVTISTFAFDIGYPNEIIELQKLDELACKLFLVHEKSQYQFNAFEKMIKKSLGIPSKLILYKGNSKPWQNYKRASSSHSDSIHFNTNQQDDKMSFSQFYQIANEHNFPELPLLFYYSPYGFLSFFLQSIYESSVFLQVKDLIQRNEHNSFFKKTFDNGYEDYKIELNKINSNSYNVIPLDVKQKSIVMLFSFYSKLWRLLINDVYTPKYSEEFINFSGVQNYGIWLSLDESVDIIAKDDKKEKENLDMATAILYHYHAFQNFMAFFIDENLNIVYENKELWNKVKEYIEELSICIPSFMKIVKKFKTGHVTYYEYMIDFDNNIYIIQNRLEKYKSEFVLSSLRLKLFIYLDGNHSIETIDRLHSLVKEFTNLNYWPGVIETLFSIAVVSYENNRHGKISDERMKEAKNFAIEIYKNQAYPNNINRKALEITLGRIYYQSAFYHINNGFFDTTDLNDLRIADEYFQKTSRIFYEIRTKSLISHWYYHSIRTQISHQTASYYDKQYKSYLEQVKQLTEANNQPFLYDEIKKEMKTLAQPSIVSVNYHQVFPYLDEAQKMFIVKIKEMLVEKDSDMTLNSDNSIMGQEKVFVISLGKNILYLSGDIMTFGEKKTDDKEMLNLLYQRFDKKNVDLIMLHMPMKHTIKDMMSNYCRHIIVIDGYNENDQEHMDNAKLFTIEIWKQLINKDSIEKTFNTSEGNWRNKLRVTLISVDKSNVIDL